MQSNGTRTVWIGDHRFAISTAEIAKLRSAQSESISSLTDLALATAIAHSQFTTMKTVAIDPGIDIFNTRETRLIQEVHSSIEYRVDWSHSAHHGPGEISSN